MKSKNLSNNPTIYTGPSMNPTLQNGDLLEVVPYNGRTIRCGDVIVFREPKEDQNVSHRVIAVNSRGIKTRGDNNCNPDEEILKPDEILGQVISANRGKRSIKVYGGFAGQLFEALVRFIRRFRIELFRPLKPLYYLAVKRKMFASLLPTQYKPKIISFDRPNGKEFQLLLGRYLIGWRKPGRDKWIIRGPFRLFVNEANLPK